MRLKLTTMCKLTAHLTKQIYEFINETINLIWPGHLFKQKFGEINAHHLKYFL